MYTANTMASAAEALGMSLPGSAAPPAPDARRDSYAVRSGEAVVALIDAGITARQILTKEAFENAITLVMALGGSTNAVLHLLAIAHEAEVELSLDDFNRIGDKVPHLADMKPFGRYVMTDIDRIGGIPVVMRALLDAGLLHGDALTVTGKTLAENLDELAPPQPDGEVIRALDAPIHRTGGLTILHGSLAPEGAVVKTAGFDAEVFEGTARVFDREQEAMAASRRHAQAGDIVVIRWEGPQRWPRHAGDARHHRRDQGRRPGQGRAAAHRRPLLRRHDRLVHRSRRARGRGRAARSPWCTTATASSSTSPTARSTSTSTTTNSSGVAPAGRRCRPVQLRRPGQVPAAWSAPPPTAPSAREPRPGPTRLGRSPACPTSTHGTSTSGTPTCPPQRNSSASSRSPWGCPPTAVQQPAELDRSRRRR